MKNELNQILYNLLNNDPFLYSDIINHGFYPSSIEQQPIYKILPLIKQELNHVIYLNEKILFSDWVILCKNKLPEYSFFINQIDALVHHLKYLSEEPIIKLITETKIKKINDNVIISHYHFF